MSSFKIGRPITNATFTYSYRDTLGTWSDEASLLRGVLPNAPNDNFVAPVCDELRITANLTASEGVNGVHLCGLSLLTGLVFEVVGASTITTVAQTSYDYPMETHRQTILFDEVVNDEFQLIITGINQQILDLDFLMFIGDIFSPEFTFDNSSPLTLGSRFHEFATNGGNEFKLDKSTRAETLTFTRMRGNEYKALNHMLKMKTVNNVVLVVVDSETGDEEDSYIGHIMLGDIGRTKDLNSVDIQAVEKYKQ